MPDGNSKGKSKSESTDAGTVLVPPAGVHTPGDTAAAGGTPLVRAPGDALSDPEGATRAYRAAQAGEVHEVGSVTIAHQHADGTALTPEERERAEAAQQRQEAQLGDPTAKPDGISK